MILIVDDDSDAQKLYSKILSQGGYECTMVATKEEALSFCSEQTPDLIIMDISLPKSDGLEVARILKESPTIQNVPIVAISALATKEIHERIAQSVCDTFLEKPFKPSQLTELIKKYIH